MKANVSEDPVYENVGYNASEAMNLPESEGKQAKSKNVLLPCPLYRLAPGVAQIKIEHLTSKDPK